MGTPIISSVASHAVVCSDFRPGTDSDQDGFNLLRATRRGGAQYCGRVWGSELSRGAQQGGGVGGQEESPKNPARPCLDRHLCSDFFTDPEPDSKRKTPIQHMQASNFGTQGSSKFGANTDEGCLLPTLDCFRPSLSCACQNLSCILPDLGCAEQESANFDLPASAGCGRSCQIATHVGLFLTIRVGEERRRRNDNMMFSTSSMPSRSERYAIVHLFPSPPTFEHILPQREPNSKETRRRTRKRDMHAIMRIIRRGCDYTIG